MAAYHISVVASKKNNLAREHPYRALPSVEVSQLWNGATQHVAFIGLEPLDACNSDIKGSWPTTSDSSDSLSVGRGIVTLFVNGQEGA